MRHGVDHSLEQCFFTVLGQVRAGWRLVRRNAHVPYCKCYRFGDLPFQWATNGLRVDLTRGAVFAPIAGGRDAGVRQPLLRAGLHSSTPATVARLTPFSPLDNNPIFSSADGGSAAPSALSRGFHSDSSRV